MKRLLVLLLLTGCARAGYIHHKLSPPTANEAGMTIELHKKLTDRLQVAAADEVARMNQVLEKQQNLHRGLRFAIDSAFLEQQELDYLATNTILNIYRRYQEILDESL